MNDHWAIVMVSLAIIIAIVFPTVGLWLFSPTRARHVKHVEAMSELVTVQISQLRISHPEIIRLDRLDRHPAYLGYFATVLAFGCTVLFVEIPYKENGAEALGTQQTLGVSLLLAAGMCLSGSTLGLHAFGRCIGRSVCNNAVSSRLGDDIRIPYVLAWWGLLSTIIAEGFYAYTVVAVAGVHRLLTTFGGLGTITFSFMAMAMIPMFILRIRRYVTEREILIDEALAIMAAEDRES